MKLMSILKRYIGYLIFMSVAFTLSGCSLFPKPDPVIEKRALADVVDAVQYAVDNAAKHSVWAATEKEAQHWADSCKVARSEADDQCLAMVDKADPICRKECSNGNCSPIALERCKSLITGQTSEAFCKANGQINAANSAWCAAASLCYSKKVETNRVCSAAEKSQLPSLLQADLSLAVEQSSEASAGVNILVVSFGGSKSEIATNSINMVLKPRVRDKAYGSVPLPADFPQNRSVSAEAQALSQQLTTLITNAVESSVKEYEKRPEGAQVAALSPLLLSDLEVTFSLTIDKNGSIGIKKAWSSVGVELGGGAGVKRSNSLTIKYGRK